MAESGHHLGLQPEVIFHLGPADITNAHLAFLFISILMIVAGVLIANQSKIVPTRAQVAIESVILWFKERIDLGFHDPQMAKRILPLIVTLFFAIFISNQFMTLPFLNVVLDHDYIFRVPTTHFAFTIALGALVLITSHLIALSISPRTHLGHYFKVEDFFKIRSFPDFMNFILQVFLGLLEIIDEIAKLISISARLFGNIFAGELMAIVVIGISTYTSFIVPIPLYALGMFVGLIQAVVFSLLSIQYLSRLANAAAAKHH